MKFFISFLAAVLVTGALHAGQPTSSDAAADSYNTINKLPPETPAHAVVSRALTNAVNAITLDGNNLGAVVPVVYSSATVALTGTAATSIPVGTILGQVNVSGAEQSQQFLLHSIRVAVLSASSVTASPVVQLVSGTTVLSGTVTLTGTGNYITALSGVTPMPLLATGSTGLPLSLNLVTGGTATALTGRVSVVGSFLQ